MQWRHKRNRTKKNMIERKKRRIRGRRRENRRENKENKKSSEGQTRSRQVNQQQKPLARARQPSGKPLHHTRQKTEGNPRNPERGSDRNWACNNPEVVILTEEKQMEKEAENLSSMLNVAWEGAVSSAESAIQD